MRRGVVLGSLIVLAALSMAFATARTQEQPKVIDIEKVRDNLYVLKSSTPPAPNPDGTPGDRSRFSGGNVAVFITDTGVVLIDTKLAGWGQAMLEKIKSVTNKPVTTIINTHTHGDHTGNNELFGTSVESIVHENTKANMAKMDAFKGEKARFLPNKTYKDRTSLGQGQDRLDLFYFGAGHTNGDTFIVFPALGILHAGDMFAWKDAPFIDRNNGGSGVAFPETLAKVLASIKGVGTVIPGHSPLMAWNDLEEYQRFNRDLLATVRDAIKTGTSVDDAVSATVKITAKYPGYQSQRVKAAVEAIYAELKP